MKRLVSIAAAWFVLLVPVLAAAAAPDSTVSTVRPNSLYKGARAIQFLSSDWMSSGSVFFKQHRAANHAFRLGFSFGAETSDTDASMDTTAVIVETGWEEQDNFSVSLEVIFQRYANVAASAHVFFGIGPFFTVGGIRDERQLTDLESGETALEKREYDSWSAGGRFVLGGEWFISRALGLDIEYYISGGYRSIDVEYDTRYGGPVLHVTEKTDELFVNGGSARIGLGIYF